MLPRHPFVASLCLVATLCGTLPAFAQARVSPQIQGALDRGFRGLTAAGTMPRSSERAQVWVRLTTSPTSREIAALERAGAEVTRLDGEVLAYRTLVPASVDAAALRAIAALPFVRRIDLAPAAGQPPMDRSAALIQLARARGARSTPHELTGKGTRLVDLDSNANLFQPVFFRGDAGYFDWLDADGNGTFDPDVDAVDLDRDGLAGTGEKLRQLRNETLDTSLQPFSAHAAGFDPGVDWVYVDTNGNGTRDSGPGGGFDDTTPAFGEPIFTPDDVNQNGTLDRGERLVRLGSSKFAEVYVSIDSASVPTAFDHVFKRGVDLTLKGNDYANGAYGFAETLHGTGVLAILAGDLPLVGRRNVGIAPDADLLLGYEISSYASKAIPWALAHKPDGVLHETANWTGAVLDGTDPYSEVVNESAAVDGVLHTCPVGNTGGSQKHVHGAPAAGEKSSFGFDVFDATFTYITLTLNARTGAGLAGTLVLPNGDRLDVTTTDGVPGGITLPNGNQFYWSLSTSVGGTNLVDVYLLNGTQSFVEGGRYLLETIAGASGGTLDAYLSDEVSGWGYGVAWDAAIATDDRTLGIPSVATGCIAIGAVPGHLASEHAAYAPIGSEAEGVRRAYSGQGPRIDGLPRLDIVAPDNPLVPTPERDFNGASLRLGQSWPFSGTSGAGPHVTGVGALLAQASIKGNAAAAAIRAAGKPTASSGSLPNESYGYGLLDAAGALGAAASGAAPVLSLSVVAASVPVGQPYEITPVVADPDAGATSAQILWDDGYDGSWDGAYGPVAPRSVIPEAVGTQRFKARVKDATGLVGEAIVTVVVTAPNGTGGMGGSAGQGGAEQAGAGGSAGSAGSAGAGAASGGAGAASGAAGAAGAAGGAAGAAGLGGSGGAPGSAGQPSSAGASGNAGTSTGGTTGEGGVSGSAGTNSGAGGSAGASGQAGSLSGGSAGVGSVPPSAGGQAGRAGGSSGAGTAGSANTAGRAGAAGSPAAASAPTDDGGCSLAVVPTAATQGEDVPRWAIGALLTLLATALRRRALPRRIPLDK